MPYQPMENPKAAEAGDYKPGNAPTPYNQHGQVPQPDPNIGYLPTQPATPMYPAVPQITDNNAPVVVVQVGGAGQGQQLPPTYNEATQN